MFYNMVFCTNETFANFLIYIIILYLLLQLILNLLMILFHSFKNNLIFQIIRILFIF